MFEVDRTFTSGEYHEAVVRRPDALRRFLLNGAYSRSFEIVESQGWVNPLSLKSPNVLLSGTAAAITTSTFVHFVLGRNPDSNIHVIDISPIPLNKSQARLREELGEEQLDRITFSQADATNTEFPANFFDLIETDMFLQFFPSVGKRALFQEWGRIMRPNGIVTTRDFVRRPGSTVERVIDIARMKAIKAHLGPQSYKSDTEEINSLFTVAGFESVIIPSRLQSTSLNLPLIKSITARKLP